MTTRRKKRQEKAKEQTKDQLLRQRFKFGETQAEFTKRFMRETREWLAKVDANG